MREILDRSVSAGSSRALKRIAENRRVPMPKEASALGLGEGALNRFPWLFAVHLLRRKQFPASA
jgi:hypothetical protein